MKRKALRAAFPYTVSIWVEFLFLGLSYGLLMRSMGLPIFYILAMSIFIFAGSMEFVTVNLLMGAFQPLNAFIMTLLVNARHLFYGLAMLGKYRDTGWKKGYLIFGMCDETFALNSAITPPEGVDRGWFYFFITLLNQMYWVSSGALGYLVGSCPAHQHHGGGLHFDRPHHRPLSGTAGGQGETAFRLDGTGHRPGVPAGAGQQELHSARPGAHCPLRLPGRQTGP